MRGDVQHAMRESEKHPKWRECGRGVVAQVFRVAEDEAGPMPVVQVPAGQRHDRKQQEADFATFDRSEALLQEGFHPVGAKAATSAMPRARVA